MNGYESSDKYLERIVSNFWDLERLGISQDENSVIANFQDNLQSIDGRYEVTLPWKQEHPLLPDNFTLSQKRLHGMFTKLRKDPVLLKEYHSIMKDQENAGIIERVNSNQTSEVGKTHYLPHHPVIREDKQTTKVRVVYDASARKRVNEADRDVLRFLWFEDPFARDPVPTTFRFTHVVFGVTCSPFLLQGTLKHHIEKYQDVYPDIRKKLTNSLYADDVNSGGYTLEESYELHKVSKQMMQDGSFNLHKWQSNSAELHAMIQATENSPLRNDVSQERATKADCSEDITINAISEEDSSFAKSTLGAYSDSKFEGTKVLGISWDNDKDNLVFNLSELHKTAKDLSPTKRNVLRVVAKIYDPLGLIPPITAPMKVFLQDLFKKRVSWDEILPEELRQKWSNLLYEFMQVGQVKIPRYYFGTNTEKPEKIELFGFADSSQSSYAAAVYAKITIKGQSNVSLVMSKTRVAPLSQQSMPRLELLSCLILSRLINHVKDSLSAAIPVEVRQCWTDSITALYWIKGTSKEWKIFVENRVQEIRKFVPASLWAHCPGKENPADIPTRWISPRQFVTSENWWTGPKWLSDEEDQWPKLPDSSTTPSNCLEEFKADKNVATSLLTNTYVKATDQGLSKLVQAERYGSYQKLLNVTAYILRFIRNCSRKEDRLVGELSADEISAAEILWIKEMHSTLSSQKLSELEHQLGIYEDKSGLFRCKGRLGNSTLPFDAKFPILLPRNNHVTKLIVLNCHHNVFHDRTNGTLAEVRSRFWIIKGRQYVKSIIRPCVPCKRIQGKSFGVPDVSDLPDFRVVEEHAFSSVGVDFAGPLYI